jgi:hypothetical protein
LKYLNINDSFHLKDLEISKYKRDSKGRWPIKMCRFIFSSPVYSFWNIRRKVLKFKKFDEKRAITPRWVIRFTSKLQGR